MKKVLSVFLLSAVLLMLIGCNKKDSLNEENKTQSPAQGPSQSSTPELSESSLQKISELREEFDNQVNTVKKSNYENLHFTEDFVAKLPESDTLYDLTFNEEEMDFKTLYEKFDKIFDNEFGDIYTEDDKEKLYHTYVWKDPNEPGSYYKDDLAKHFDDLMNGEDFVELSIDTDKAYLCMLCVGEGSVHELYHDGIIKRARPEEMPNCVFPWEESNYFDIEKIYLEVDSEDRYVTLDAELSIKEAAEMAKEITSENEYSWGGALEPEVFQLNAVDIGEGKYGFTITLTPSYKGVRFDSYQYYDSSAVSLRGEKLEHDYDLSMPTAFMMESGKFERFSLGRPEYTVTEDAEYDSVISLENAIQLLSEKFGTEMNLQVSWAELMYSGMYSINEEESAKKTFPVWKFKCYNTTDNFLYFVYINAINGNIEYYLTDRW